MSAFTKSFVIIIFLQSFWIAGAWCQISPAAQDLTIDEIIHVLEKKYSTRIFYEPEWFEGIAFGRKVAELPLEQAVFNIVRGLNLSVTEVEGYLVIIPVDPSSSLRRDDDTLILTIGDPSEFGRYNRVDLKGRILDGTTGESLPGAVIYSERTGTGSSADPEGSFSINLPVGELLLRLSYVGYEDQYRRNTDTQR